MLFFARKGIIIPVNIVRGTMNFLRKIEEIFKKLAGGKQGDGDRTLESASEDIRWQAIRRKLKDIGYRTDKIETIPRKGK